MEKLTETGQLNIRKRALSFVGECLLRGSCKQFLTRCFIVVKADKKVKFKILKTR